MVLLAVACASVPTPKLERWHEGYGYRVDLDRPSIDDNATLVILTFSGGGTRAAAFSYGVLKQLRQDRLGSGPDAPRVLDEVDVISSVSGGSFTAAYYAMYGETAFDDFETRFLKADIQSRLIRLLFNPMNLIRLMSPYFCRSDLAAQYYDQHVFRGETYATLVEADRRPYVVVNAANLATGDRFQFTQDVFDILCADLSRVPLSRAVAASSAFPGLLSPITFENRAGGCGYREDPWVREALDPTAPDNPGDRVAEARRLRAYQDTVANRWIHLIDGGVADNIGLRGPLHAIATLDDAWSVLARMNLEEVDRLVVIIVDAKPGARSDVGTTRRTPGLKAVLGAAATVPMGKYSFDTVELLKERVDQAKKDAALAAGCAESGRCPPGSQFHPIEYYPIHVNFDAERNCVVRERLEKLPTTFALDDAEIDDLVDAGGRLLRESPEYERLLRDMRTRGGG